MKNVHLLSTDKPSRFFIDNKGKFHFREFFVPDTIQICKNYNIYITSDEEIKEGDYGLDTFHKETRKFRNKNFVSKYDRKIILTTDPDLDGVQAIDDEFLQWFVKNPSCEFVEVQNQYRVKSGTIQEHIDGIAGYEYYEYKIIIPQEESKLINNCPKCGLDLIEREGSTPVCHRVDCGGIILSNETLREWALKKEPKQEDFEYVSIGEERIKIPIQEPEQEYQSECICENSCRGFVNVKCKQLNKQETLEEVAKEIFKGECICNGIDIVPAWREGFVTGAKWQAEQLYKDDIIQTLEKALALVLKKQERMYSEEEVIKLLQQYRYDLSSGKTPNIGDTTGLWFKQFKKKQ